MVPRRTLALLFALCASCTIGSAACGDAAPPPRTLRAVMFEVDFAVRVLEPNQRNPGARDQIREALAKIDAALEEPSFTQYTARPEFRSDAELFRKFHDQLRSAVADATAANEAGDLDAFRDAYIRMDQTCTACHKRFQPNY